MSVATHRADTASPFDGRPISGLQRRVFLFCGLVTMFDGFDVQSISFAAPAISATLDIPKEAFGLLFSTGIVGMLLGLILQGPIADRWGRRPMIILSVAAFGVATLLTAGASSILELAATRLLAGLGLGAALPNAIALTSEYAPARARTRLIVAMNAGLPIGGFLGGLLSAHLIDAFGWRSIFIVGGFGPLLLVPLLWFRLPESLILLAARGQLGKTNALLADAGIDEAIFEPMGPRAARFPIVSLLREGRTRDTLLLWAMFILNMFLFYFLIAWFPTLLSSAGLPVERAILVAAGLNLGSVIGGLLLGWLADRGGTRVALASAFGLASSAFLVLAFAGFSTFLPHMILAGLLGLSIGGAQLVLNAVAVGIYPPEMRATGIGVAGAMGRGGAIAGPIIGGVLLGNRMTIDMLYGLMAVPALLTLVVALSLSHRTVRANPTEEKPGEG